MEVKILGKPSFMKGTRKDMNFFVAFWSFEPNNPGFKKVEGGWEYKYGKLGSL